MDAKDDTETTATEVIGIIQFLLKTSRQRVCPFQSETEKRVIAGAKEKKVSLVTDKKNDLLLANR